MEALFPLSPDQGVEKVDVVGVEVWVGTMVSNVVSMAPHVPGDFQELAYDGSGPSEALSLAANAGIESLLDGSPVRGQSAHAKAMPANGVLFSKGLQDRLWGWAQVEGFVVPPCLQFPDEVSPQERVRLGLLHELVKGLYGLSPGESGPFVGTPQDMLRGFFICGASGASRMVPHLAEEHASAHTAYSNSVFGGPAPLASGETPKSPFGSFPVDSVKCPVWDLELFGQVRGNLGFVQFFVQPCLVQVWLGLGLP